MSNDKNPTVILMTGTLGHFRLTRALMDSLKEEGMPVVVACGYDDPRLTDPRLEAEIHPMRLSRPELFDFGVETLPEDKTPYWRRFERKRRS